VRAREIIEPAYGVVALMKRYRALGAGILLASFAMTVGEPARGATRGTYVIDERPALLSYDDLVELASPRPWGPDLEGRLETLLSTPFVNNEAFYRGAEPFRPVEPGLQEVMRVVSWNIEQGLRFDLIRALFTDDREFRSHLDRDAALNGKERRELEREIAMLRSADVLVLQEVDWGMGRTGYARIAEELGRALDMNWAYGVGFVEVDSFNLGIEELAGVAAGQRAETRRGIGVDEARYEGLQGIVVLSRYPIRSARLLPLRAQAYDWFADEIKKVSLVESAKRKASETLFINRIGRQIRLGGRTLLVVELDVPDLPLGAVTIAATHLESRADPAGRREQIAEVLSYLGDIPHPVVLAGDMNTSSRDGTPTSWKREVSRRAADESFWISQGLKYASGLGVVLDLVNGGIGLLRTHH
jgi:endonuclease/exonuclease/phosphatase family metal-dependent hydrolase